MAGGWHFSDQTPVFLLVFFIFQDALSFIKFSVCNMWNYQGLSKFYQSFVIGKADGFCIDLSNSTHCKSSSNNCLLITYLQVMCC